MSQPDERAITSVLAAIFGSEWDKLSTSDRQLIVRDCIDDGGQSIAVAGDYAEYRQSIGRGNLQSYANVMRARFSKLR